MTTQTHAEPERELKPAVLRGLKSRCPHCGEGKLFSRYLKVRDCCSACGEELYHHRADDGPAYLTILIVAHVMGFVMHASFGYLKDDPLTLALLLCAMATVLSLLMLPRMKGLLVGIQWAKRMHGFGRKPA
ncbi:Uncharacterized conserved protein, DUF983 family [Pseudooceanicola antarcticus]|uniref:DUF983 domain-containing protein n=1 Tax=Pseudooceanicola antarcticus TaxID=1247613 RepID=A0A285IW13_9RHOB|nr:DUF983 domain-containing protein [Pseudooceanicola antarcticus]PJE25990.1 DUF983 domain-containing protein [Pseudooceanicola antarcticus]SNY52172.1 Uncharacterized conserved protein, DUF983 family [Pseudooceanicola antarcticus]